jgi:hypothetical protein
LFKEIWSISGHKNVERKVFGIDVDCSPEKVWGKIDKICKLPTKKVKLIPRPVCIHSAI